jgi:Tol biopolymer transport system component
VQGCPVTGPEFSRISDDEGCHADEPHWPIDALDDQGVLSPDDSHVAFVSTRGTYRANIWVLDLKTKQLRNLTGQPGIQGDPMKPDAFLRPAWSPDGRWIAFSSDRNTEWTDHGNHTGWEHLQELSVYIVHADGTRLRRITGPGICSGSPKWSADGKQLVFYEMPVETNMGCTYLLSIRARHISDRLHRSRNRETH